MTPSSVSNNSGSNYDNVDVVVHVLHFTPFSAKECETTGWYIDNIPDWYLGGDLRTKINLKLQHDCVAFLMYFGKVPVLLELGF